MFTKVGSPQPMNVLSKCCICGNDAKVKKNGQLYCDDCASKEQDLVNEVNGTNV